MTTPAGTRSFGYDANGNLTTITGAGGNHTLTWFSDNKPKKVTDAATGELSEFWYDAERSRWKQVSQSPSGSEIRYYVEGGLYERLHTGGTIHHIHQIQVAGRIVAQVKRFPSAPEQVRWFHTDHLGSVEAISREDGTVEERFSYDAWGKRRDPDTRITPPPGQFLSAVGTWRGYTGHEHLDHVGLIHMNGRVYMPDIGRFASPDSVVQFPTSTQGLNRYAYLSNNPLNATDPTGNFSFKALINIAVTAVATYFGSPILGGAVSGYLSSGGDLKAAVLGAMGGAIMAGLSSALPATGSFGQYAGSLGAQGAVSGAMAKASGGSFRDGFLGGAVGAAFAPAMNWERGRFVGKVTVAAVGGGTVSKLTGGKFANGATSGAFAYAVSEAQGRATGNSEGEWIYPEGGSTGLNEYDTVMTNGVGGNRAEFQQLVTESRIPGYFNPSQGRLADITEAFRQKFFGWSGDQLATGFARGLATVDHPMTIIAHSQGTLTVANAVKYYGLSTRGSTFVMKSPALSSWMASRAIGSRGGILDWRMPYGDVANVYAPSLSPFRWASGFGDLLCGACTHTANGLP